MLLNLRPAGVIDFTVHVGGKLGFNLFGALAQFLC